MSKDSITDYLSYILFRLAGFIIRKLPVNFCFFLGRRLGDLLYGLDYKHRAIAYSNIKIASGGNLSCLKLSQTVRGFYRAYGQNLMEVFLMPIIDQEYVNKYITFEGWDNIDEAVKKGKGIIFLAVHEGSWELSSLISPRLGFQFNFLFRGQKNFKRLGELLNSYRAKKGCRIIQTESQTRHIIEAIKNNEAIGMTMDQGGKTGCLVNFFGKSSSMATGAVRLGLKYGVTILPIFFVRMNGPYVKLFIDQVFELKKTEDREKDVRENLQRLMSVYEKYISAYPNEYLWTYKIWKYGADRKILILSDGKAGHLRQSQALAGIINESLKERGFKVSVETEETKFKSNYSRLLLNLSSLLSGKYNCQGCLFCLKKFLEAATLGSLIGKNADIIISCGSTLAAVNYMLSRENLAKSIVLMRPSFLSTDKFNLVIVPRHDNPPNKKNIVATEGALNLINDGYLKEQVERLSKTYNLKPKTQNLYLGLLLGGDTKKFRLEENVILEVIKQIKMACEKLGADILVTTSRRTSPAVEALVKKELEGYTHCKLLIIANEKNIPEAIGGILGLSNIIITSSESISMISEAASSGKYVLVFNTGELSRKHARFLKRLSENKYISLAKSVADLSKTIEDIWMNKPKVQTLPDNLLIREAINRIL